MVDIDKTKHPEPVVDLPRKVTVKSIPERRDEYHVTIATLLGCVIAQEDGFLSNHHSYYVGCWRYKKYHEQSGKWVWSTAHPTAAEAARTWLIANDHDLNGWQGREDEATPQR